ncbi:MAG: hypothetical protein J7L46_05125 [Bacteroidales bacterium]|nr:hypothetical protein [Bacteroidales bacterium]
MMKKTVLFSLMVFVFGSLFSQTIETIDWGVAQELQKNTQYKKVIGYDADGVYLVREDKYNHNKLWLDYVSRLTMTVDQTNELVLPSYLGNQTKYADMFYVNKKLILLSTAVDNNSNQKQLFLQYMNTNGTIKNKPKLVGTISTSNAPEDDFKWEMTDKNQIYISYHKTFKEYNQEPFSFKVFDSNLQEVASYNLSLPEKFNARKFEIKQTAINDKGKIIMMVKAVTAGKKRSSRVKADQYEMLVVIYDTRKKETHDIKVALKKGKPIDGIFTFDKDGNLIVGGFYEPKTNKIPGSFTGLYYRIINPNTYKVIPAGEPKYYFSLFSKDFMLKMKAARNGETTEQQFSYKLKSIETMENGSFIIIAEQQYVVERTMTDPKTKQDIVIKYNTYGDILMAGVDKNQKFAWIKKIYKKQVSTDDHGYYSSYALVKIRNKIKIIYNDVSANLKINEEKLNKIKVLKNNLKTIGKGMAVVNSVFYDGSIIKDPLFPGKDKKNTIVPSLIVPVEDQHFTFSQKSKKYKFGIFVLE